MLIRFITKDGTNTPQLAVVGWLPPAGIGARPLSVIPRCLRRGGFIMAVTALALKGDVVWEKTHTTVVVISTDEKIPVEFTFRNASSIVESFISIDVDCGCVALEERKKKDFAPGESGKIVASVEVRKKRGIVEKHISVLTTDRPDKPTILTARIVILPAAEMGIAELSWAKDEAPQEKDAPIILRKKLETRLSPLSLEADEVLQAELLPASETEGPRLRVKPRKAGVNGIYTLFVEIKGSEENFSLPLLVRLDG